MISQGHPAPTYTDNFKKICEQPLSLIGFLQRARLSDDLSHVSMGISDALSKVSFETTSKPVGKEVRMGGKGVAIEGSVWGRHWETSDQRPWVDIIEFENKEACERVFNQNRQDHSGAPCPDSFRFITINKNDGLDAVSVIVKRDLYLFNFGLAIPFKIKTPDEGENEPEELRYISTSIDSLTLVMEAVARQLVDPGVITWVPPALPDKNQVRLLRLAGFARLWSEAKYNFAFFERLPDLDWEGILELYLPRIDAARTQEEYVRLLQECFALLRDGHTWVDGRSSGDTPLLNIEPIEGRPVVTAIGDTPEIRASGIQPGMELVEVNGEAISQRLARAIYPYVFASTPQDRDIRAFKRLLEAEPDSTITATFLDIDGKAHTVKLVCDLSKHRDAAPWTKRPPPFEHQKLPGEIVYAAVNTFGMKKAIQEFDHQFDDILASKGFIIDVRQNDGGDTTNGSAIIARLIEKPCDLTSQWRTRLYRPAFRAWGRTEEWHEGTHPVIQPRGDKPFLGPVVVLIGPKTYSAAEDFLIPLKASRRAILIGEPTGGSTGQPLFLEVYGASAGICTKWDRFPDGTEFVGVGVQPDILVQRTKQDVVKGRDPALEKAIAFLKQNL